jgi:hypothetical protein
MGLIRRWATLCAALSCFVAAPSSADVIYQFNGVCDRYFNVSIGSSPEFVPCDTLADPTVQLTLTLDDKYPSVGFTACINDPAFTCLLYKIVWTDHADAGGAELTVEASASIGRSCQPIVDGVPPLVSIFAERIECGFDLFVGTSFTFETIDTFTPGVDHFVEGSGVWTQIAGPVDEPTTLALAGLALFPLAFVRRRNSQ